MSGPQVAPVARGNEQYEQVIQQVARAVDASLPLQTLLQGTPKSQRLRGELARKNTRLLEMKESILPTITAIGTLRQHQRLISSGLAEGSLQALQQRLSTTRNPIVYEWGDTVELRRDCTRPRCPKSVLFDVIVLPSPILRRCTFITYERGHLPVHLQHLLDTSLPQAQQIQRKWPRSLCLIHQVSGQAFRIARRCSPEQVATKANTFLDQFHGDKDLAWCARLTKELYTLVNTTKPSARKRHRGFKQQLQRILADESVQNLQRLPECMSRIQSKLVLSPRGTRWHVSIRSIAQDFPFSAEWTRTVGAEGSMLDCGLSSNEYLRRILKCRMDGLLRIARKYWEDAKSVLFGLRRMKGSKDVLWDLITACSHQLDNLPQYFAQAVKSLEESVLQCALDSSNLEECMLGCALSPSNVSANERLGRDVAQRLNENFIKAWNDHYQGHIYSPMEPFFAEFDAFQRGLYEDMTFSDSTVPLDPQTLEGISGQLRECETSLQELQSLCEPPTENPSTTLLENQPLVLTESSRSAVSGMLRKKLVLPAANADRFAVDCTVQDVPTIQCSISVGEQRIRYAFPYGLQERFRDDPFPFLFVTSEIRASSPMSDASYPRLFTDQWTTKRRGPSVVLVIDASEKEQYEEYLSTREHLWSPEHPHRPVVLMQIELEGHNPQQRLSGDRKKQMIKSLMDALYESRMPMLMEQYVVSDDDIHHLEILDGSNQSQVVSIPDAVELLRRLMFKYRLCEHDEFAAWLHQLRSLYRSSGLSDWSEVNEPLRLAASLAESRQALWYGLRGDATWTWNKLVYHVEKLFAASETARAKLQVGWNVLVDRRERVAMASVMNYKLHQAAAKMSEMSPGATYCLSTQMYTFVMHDIASCRGINYMKPSDFYAISGVGLPRGQSNAMRIGDKHLALLAQRSNRLTLMTTLVGMERTPIPSRRGDVVPEREAYIPADRPPIPSIAPASCTVPRKHHATTPFCGENHPNCDVAGPAKLPPSGGSLHGARALQPRTPAGKRRDKQKKESPAKKRRL